MPRSITTSFADGLARLLQELAMVSVAPDADLEFIDTITAMIRERLSNPSMGPEGVAVAGAQPGFSAAEAQGPAGAPQGSPMQTAAAPTRLPPTMGRPGRDEISELQRVMAGS